MCIADGAVLDCIDPDFIIWDSENHEVSEAFLSLGISEQESNGVSLALMAFCCPTRRAIWFGIAVEILIIYYSTTDDATVTKDIILVKKLYDIVKHSEIFINNITSNHF